jgi:hypothetical protein
MPIYYQSFCFREAAMLYDFARQPIFGDTAQILYLIVIDVIASITVTMPVIFGS